MSICVNRTSYWFAFGTLGWSFTSYTSLLLQNRRFRHEPVAEVRPVTVMVDDVQLGCVRHLRHCVRRTATGGVGGLIRVLEVFQF